MDVTEQQAVTKRTVTLTSAELMKILQCGVVEDGETRIQIPEDERLPLVAELTS